jgi:hypothetical protein
MKLDYSFKISIQIHLKFVEYSAAKQKHSSTVTAYLQYLVNKFPSNNP